MPRRSMTQKAATPEQVLAFKAPRAELAELRRMMLDLDRTAEPMSLAAIARLALAKGLAAMRAELSVKLRAAALRSGAPPP